MIRLSISYGYAWSVWEDKGGLQPDIESLALPRKFVAPLKAWTFREDMTLHEPMFSTQRADNLLTYALATSNSPHRVVNPRDFLSWRIRHFRSKPIEP